MDPASTTTNGYMYDTMKQRRSCMLMKNLISRSAAESYQGFKIQGHDLQLVNESERVIEVNTVVDRLTYEEQSGKQKPEQKGKEVILKENKIAVPQSTTSLTFRRKLGKLSSLSEPPVSPLKTKLSSKTSSRTCTVQRESATLFAARQKEFLSLNMNSILEAASNVMESKVAQTLHSLSNVPERTTHRKDNGPHSNANGILYRGRRTSMRALRPKLAPSERVRLLRKKRTVKNEEVMALVPVMPLVPVSVVPNVRPTGGNKKGEPYRRILPKPSMVPLTEHDGSAKDEASDHSDPVVDQMISDRLNAMPFIIQSVPSSVIMVGKNGATCTSDPKKSTRKRKNNPSTESRTHQWRLNEAEEEKEKDCEKGHEEESDCEDIESFDEEEDDVIEIKEELEDDDEEYATIILQEEEEEKEDEEQEMTVIVKEEELDKEEEEDQAWRSLDNESNVKQENGYHSLRLELEGQNYDQPRGSNLGPQEPEIQPIRGIRIKEEPKETYTW